MHTLDGMTSSSRTLLILGASGDLTSRLLLPSLGALLARTPDRTVTVRGAGRDEWDEERWRTTVTDAVGTGAAGRVTIGDYTAADVTDPAALGALLATVGPGTVLYFALPPAITRKAVDALRGAELPDDLVLAMEKPFGDDAASARSLNAALTALVPEDRIFRVDHFLGRSMILNLLGLRLANRMWDPVWSAEHVESVLIRFDESLALENRAGYYDHAGAMIDMIQSHLLQVLGLVAMEPPATLGERDLRDAKAAALRATHVWRDAPETASHRARYTAGTVDGKDIPSYVDEEGVDPSHGTETLAEVVFEVANERWAGVPFVLRSGKALPAKRSEVVVTFRPVRHLPAGLSHAPRDGGRLTFALGPDRMTLGVHVTSGDEPFDLREEDLVAEMGQGQQRSYEEVLDELLDGDVTLSVRADEAEDCWRILQPIRDAWAADTVPLQDYPAGTAGPDGWPSTVDPAGIAEAAVTAS